MELTFIEEKEKVRQIRVRIKDIQLELGSHKISGNEQYRMNVKGAEPTELNIRRKELTSELLTLEKELHSYNTKKENRFQSPIFQQNLLNILKETLGKEEYLKITSESLSRSIGSEPKKIIINYGFSENDKQEINRLKKIAIDLKEKMLTARKEIDRYIRQNEPEVNKADYHNRVKVLIRSMPPEKEIYNLKIV